MQPDVHAVSTVEHAEELAVMIGELGLFDRPVAEADRRIQLELEALTTRLSAHKPERVVELARLACLPWSHAGQVKPDTVGGLAKAEVLSLLALTMVNATDDGSAANEAPNSLYQEAHGWAESVGTLINLLEARLLIIQQDLPRDNLDRVSTIARIREVWIRNTSYADMVRSTHSRLFSKPDVQKALRTTLGFDASQANTVLSALDDLQLRRVNGRIAASFEYMGDAYSAADKSDPAVAAEMRILWNRAWQPTADIVAVSSPDIAAESGIPIRTVEAVLKQFTANLATQDSRTIVDAFMSGDNPLRSHPVVRSSRGESMLVHSALLQQAIRENLEQEMKAMACWESYASWRGDVLEELGRDAFEKVLPGATTHFAFDYYVPANDAEEAKEPSGYTKRVEGDLLFVLHDIAVIVEAKAAAVIPAARAGETRILRRNLVDIVTKASRQASRLQDRIEEDGGIRLHVGGWLDLRHIREVHTVALSLEDLPGVATATADLIEAELLSLKHIPWIVSIHDLQLIAEVVDRPAEFLLYLRRRRDPEVSLAYTAPDELDFFMYFYEKGLYVEPDPVKVVSELPYRQAPTTRELRRRASLGRTYISSRTDPLDAWHYGRTVPSFPPAAKPTLTRSPMVALADELQRRQDWGWLSLGATLLSGSTKAQSDWARVPSKLIARSTGDGRERTLTVPVGSNLKEAWLLVWMTRPAGYALSSLLELAAEYLRAKKYQLKFSRGAVLVYDETTKSLIDVVYDGTLPTPDAAMDVAVQRLFPVEAMVSPRPPRAQGLRKLSPKKRKKGRKRR